MRTFRKANMDEEKFPVPHYTESQALAYPITLSDGTISTAGKCSPWALLRWFVREVRTIYPSMWSEKAKEALEDVGGWDNCARWYLVNELECLRSSAQGNRQRDRARHRRDLQKREKVA